jgi:amino acid transporter
LSPYPDICAFSISLLLTGVLCIGVKKSTRFNNVLTILNVAVVVFVTISGFIKADTSNWTIPQEELPKDKELVL